MSFQDIRPIHRGGSGYGAPLQPIVAAGGRPSAGGDSQGYHSAVSQVHQMSKSLARLKRLDGMLGGPNDTVELRQQATGILDEMASNAQQVTASLQNMRVPADAGQCRHDQAAVAKLVSDFSAVMHDFRRVQSQLSGKAMQHMPKISAASRTALATIIQVDGSREAEEEAALLARGEKIQLDNMVEYNEAMIEERDEGIAHIQQQVRDVNEIFQDLAVLVKDQGDQLVVIESNVARTAEDTAKGRGYLVQAQRSMKSSCRRWCWTTLILVAVLGFLVFILQL